MGISHHFFVIIYLVKSKQIGWFFSNSDNIWTLQVWNPGMDYINLFVCFLPLFRKSPLISSQDFYPSAEVYLSALSRLVLTTLAIVIWIASLQDTQFAYIPNELANTISPYFQVSAFLDKTSNMYLCWKKSWIWLQYGQLSRPFVVGKGMKIKLVK